MSNITRYRADTYPIRVTLRDSDGKLLNLSGSSFLFTVNSEAAPADASSQIFQSIGSIVIPVTDGVVEFPVAGTTDAGEYFFDIEMTDSSGKTRTVEKGAYVLLQDVTKSDASGVIEFSGETIGESIPLDRSGVFIPYRGDDGDSYNYETRDTSTVIRCVYGTKYTNYLAVGGALAPFTNLPLGVRVKMKVYFDPGNSGDSIAVVLREKIPGGFDRYATSAVFSEKVDLYIRTCVNGRYIWLIGTDPRTQTAGWYWIGLELAADGLGVSSDVWVDGDAEPSPWAYGDSFVTPITTRLGLSWELGSTVAPQESTFELERIEWELI